MGSFIPNDLTKVDLQVRVLGKGEDPLTEGVLLVNATNALKRDHLVEEYVTMKCVSGQLLALQV